MQRVDEDVGVGHPAIDGEIVVPQDPKVVLTRQGDAGHIRKELRSGTTVEFALKDLLSRNRAVLTTVAVESTPDSGIERMQLTRVGAQQDHLAAQLLLVEVAAIAVR